MKLRLVLASKNAVIEVLGENLVESYSSRSIVIFQLKLS